VDAERDAARRGMLRGFPGASSACGEAQNDLYLERCAPSKTPCGSRVTSGADGLRYALRVTQNVRFSTEQERCQLLPMPFTLRSIQV
jgi:hypothetical protein